MGRAILYSYFRSTAAWRVRLALGIKQIEYEYRPINLYKGEQLGPDFMKISPLGQVPVLLIDDTTLVQSVAILEYLEETRPERPLLPSDPLIRAKVREIVEMVNSGLHPLVNLSAIEKYSMDKPKQIEWLLFWGAKGFQGMEQVLAKSSGKYSVGDELTLADLFIVPQVANGIRWGVNFKNYPKTFEIYERLFTLKTFQDALPSRQPDCPQKLR